MKVSVIVPVLNEETTIGAALDSLGESGADEILVVDGGSEDRTTDICARRNCRLLRAERGRARQMNAGAAAATGDAFVFLHADSRLGEGAVRRAVEALATPGVVGGAFRLRLAPGGVPARLVSLAINLRSRLLRAATGDQALFVRRDAFFAAGGFPDIPFLEDVAMWRRLGAVGRLVIDRPCVTTSSRRFVESGWLRTVLAMWRIRVMYRLGASPDRLKRVYPEVRSVPRGVHETDLGGPPT